MKFSFLKIPLKPVFKSEFSVSPCRANLKFNKNGIKFKSEIVSKFGPYFSAVAVG